MTLTIALVIVIFGGAIIVRNMPGELRLQLPAVIKMIGVGICLGIWSMSIGVAILELATIWH